MAAATAEQIKAAPTREEILAGDFCDVKTAAEQLAVQRSTVYAMMDQGHLAYLRVGGQRSGRRVSVVSLEHYRRTNLVVRTSATKPQSQARTTRPSAGALSGTPEKERPRRAQSDAGC